MFGNKQADAGEIAEAYAAENAEAAQPVVDQSDKENQEQVLPKVPDPQNAADINKE